MEVSPAKKKKSFFVVGVLVQCWRPNRVKHTSKQLHLYRDHRCPVIHRTVPMANFSNTQGLSTRSAGRWALACRGEGGPGHPPELYVEVGIKSKKIVLKNNYGCDSVGHPVKKFCRSWPWASTCLRASLQLSQPTKLHKQIQAMTAEKPRTFYRKSKNYKANAATGSSDVTN